MSDLRDEYGNPIYRTTDEYGNMVYTDQYGSPLTQQQQQPYAAGTGPGYGAGITGTGGYGTATTGYAVGGAQQQPVRMETHEQHQGLRRSGSSSSSSSEDEVDEHGVRRKKKGMKEKIKEKMPGMGGHMGEEQRAHEGVAGAGYTQQQQQQRLHGEKEKKGVLEKIKEKLPGHRRE